MQLQQLRADAEQQRREETSTWALAPFSTSCVTAAAAAAAVEEETAEYEDDEDDEAIREPSNMCTKEEERYTAIDLRDSEMEKKRKRGGQKKRIRAFSVCVPGGRVGGQSERACTGECTCTNVSSSPPRRS